ncbi:VIT1/CCC1 transporter family protein [Gulosibacter molinativorax]|uniref:Rubrerythrin family protein n=1 Tax=Gulosibacter molinativorax TaxID=256821 RepID=A0ABT7C6G1_9MICO|nr:VIT1/CCC1 transporter family protein [Gulosibacter molinativorax]MDJ1370766.1 rubrerythrin family protein [Gulosibacter molinativorax]QUY63207.1 Fe 2+/Mn2+ transporter pcl1 [Gulosibacter molinativorax]
MPNRIEHRPDPSPQDVRRWRRYLANERAEGETYRQLAKKRTGEEREILLGLAEAEKRHEQHWIDKLGPLAEKTVRPDFNTRLFGLFAKRFGSVFALALMQNFEARTPYAEDPDATDQMEADERVHEEVVRSLATRSRARMSGTFRAAVFGANDGLVSNLALVLGVGATGVSSGVILATGISGLLAGALSMAAGEYVSVSSQRELLNASTPNPDTSEKLPALDVNANELALVYRARGMGEDEAKARAEETLRLAQRNTQPVPVDHHGGQPADHEELGTPMGAATSSFMFFAVGALIPVLPWIFGLEGMTAVIVSAAIVGIALLLTGGIVGVLSGATPWKRALRQLIIGYGAAAITYLLGLAFGGVVSG